MQSFKKLLISTFGCSISVKALDKNQLILITHSAAVCGTPTFEDSESMSRNPLSCVIDDITSGVLGFLKGFFRFKQ